MTSSQDNNNLAQVYFTTSPAILSNSGTPFGLRTYLALLAEENEIEFEDFEVASRKTLVAVVGNYKSVWEYKDNVWDFHDFRSRGIDLAQATIFWRKTCKVWVDEISITVSYESRQSFEEFERIVLSKRIVQPITSPIIEVKVGSQMKPFTEAVLQQYIADNKPLELNVRSRHASYSKLIAQDVLPLFDFSPNIDNAKIRWKNGDAEISKLFTKLTASNNEDFDTQVEQWTDILLEVNESKPFGLSLGFDYLRFIQPCFPPQPGQNKDWNETQRITICDPIMYTVAAILSQRVYEEVEVWPSILPNKEALGHGPLDYFLSTGPAAVVMRKGEDTKADEANANEKTEGEDEADQIFEDIMSEKKTTATVRTALAQVLAQALDTMKEGSLPTLHREGQTGNAYCADRRFCVLSTGQRYFFFRIDWNAQEKKSKPLVLFLGLFHFRYFPSRYEIRNVGPESMTHRSSDLSPDEEFNKREYAAVLAAFLVCALDKKTEVDLRNLLENAGTRFAALQSTIAAKKT